ncbi:MAG: hypothetical protein ABW173_06775 [Sphingomonas sp.]
MTPAPLDILLYGGTEAEVAHWLTLNLGWIDPATDRLIRLPDAADCAIRRELPIVRGTARRTAEAACLLVSIACNLRADWRGVVTRIEGFTAMDSATGRLLVEDGEGHTDLTPPRIAAHVTDWSIDPRFHAVGCTALPTEILWVSARAAARLRLALDGAGTVAAAIRQFHMPDAMLRAGRLNLYLPDFVAFRDSVPA